MIKEPEIRKVDFKKIQELQLDQGLGKMAFCEKAGISHKTYNRLGNGNRVRDCVIIKIASALDVKASTIIYWEEIEQAVGGEG